MGDDPDENKYAECVEKLASRWNKTIPDAVKKNIRDAQDRQKSGYDKRHATSDSDFKVGQKVLLINLKNVARKGGKAQLPRSGPYTIEHLTDRKTAQLKNKYGKVLATKYSIRHLVPLREKTEKGEITEVIPYPKIGPVYQNLTSISYFSAVVSNDIAESESRDSMDVEGGDYQPIISFPPPSLRK